jgi:hypothetical protein
LTNLHHPEKLKSFPMRKAISSYFIPAFILLSYCSCNNKSVTNLQSATIPQNDTTRALKMLFDSTVDLPRLVDVDLLYKNNPFGDSLIILKDTSYPASFLPHTHKFKLMSYDEIDTAVSHWPASLDISNYLIVRFAKTSDTTYRAVINNIPISRPGKIIGVCDGCQKQMTFRKRGDSLISSVSDVAEFQ